jgi:hypothetical protein
VFAVTTPWNRRRDGAFRRLGRHFVVLARVNRAFECAFRRNWRRFERQSRTFVSLNPQFRSPNVEFCAPEDEFFLIVPYFSPNVRELTFVNQEYRRERQWFVAPARNKSFN